MTQTLHRNIERLRMLVVLFVASLSAMTVSALESDDISAAILTTDGTLAVRWINDPDLPWELSEYATYIRTPDAAKTDTTTLTMTYTSEYPTEISFEGRSTHYWDPSKLVVYVDGELKATINNTDYLRRVFFVPAGNHTVQFISIPYDTEYEFGDYAAIRNLRVWNCKPLETACLDSESLPLTFENDPDHIWVTEDGYIRTSSFDENGNTEISTTFTIEEPSMFSFQSKASDYYCYIDFIIDGNVRKSQGGREWITQSVILNPGTHTIIFRHSHDDYYSDYGSQIRNVRLYDKWINVELSKAGELSGKLYQALGGMNLQDAKIVKISGPLNSDDWSVINQLDGICGLDLSEAQFTSVPNGPLRKSRLSKVMLPDGVQTIETQAFRGTDLYQMLIPASVTEIGSSSFRESQIESITFAEGSQLTSIRDYAFYNCDHLLGFIMPNSVTSIESNVFEYCYALKTLHFSDGLTDIPIDAARYCTSLTDVKLPVGLLSIQSSAFYNTPIQSIVFPETLQTIGSAAFADSRLLNIELPGNVYVESSAFSNCKYLREIIMNSRFSAGSYAFRDCTSLQKIIMRCATPPSVGSNVFYGVTLSNIELIVPDFAYDYYKQDLFWYNFTNTRPGDEASLREFWSIRGNLALDNNHIMRGNPAVEMYSGSISIAPETNQTFGKIIFENGAAFYNQSTLVSADTLHTRMQVTANRWRFFSPVCDIDMTDISFSDPDGAWVIRYYDGARRASEDTNTGNWVNVPSNGTLKRGQGYIVQANVDGYLEMPIANANKGAFFSTEAETLQLDDNPCGTPDNAGWNFVGNPYPTYYDIYYLDMQAPITVWNGSTYRAYSLNDGDRGDDTFVLRPFEPLFIQKASADLTLGMPLTGKQATTAIDRTHAPRREPAADAPTRHKLNLELMRADSEEADDYTRVVINDEASLGYETSCDASKFMSLDAQVAQIYTLGDKNHPMAINERPYADGNVKLGVYLPTAGETYVIAARRADRQTWIHDAVTGIEHDLTTGDYTFTASKSGHDTARFTLRFAPGATGIESVDAAEIRVEGLTGAIAVTAPAGADVAVYAVDGTVAARFTADETTRNVELTAGLYVVTVNSESFKTIVK